jgi:outer membrane protein OmpA-like peptidoglycan-associated protein
VNQCPAFKISIEGHTDSEGIPERNNPLSERRARAVADYLIAAGVEASRVSTVGYGAERPIADNDTAAGRAKNRRIEFKVIAE